MRIAFSICQAIIAVSISVTVVGQASFSLRNRDVRAGVDAPVRDWEGGLLSVSNWRVELYGGTEPNSLTPLWAIYQNRREILPLAQPGYFFSNAGSLSVLAAPQQGWAWLQVKVWDATLGATYEEALARGLGGHGQSALFYAQGGGPLLNPPTLPGPLIGLESFSVHAIIPEPSPCALLLLGGLGLCWAGSMVRMDSSRNA